MAKTQTPPLFKVQREEGDGDLREIGTVSVDARGILSLVSASAAFRVALQDIVDTVNALEELRIKVPPPPGEEPGALYRRNISRSDPDVLESLQAYLDQKYGLRLEAT